MQQTTAMQKKLKYKQSSYFVIFAQFRLYMGLYQLRKRDIGVLTPSFGPSEGHKDP